MEFQKDTQQNNMGQAETGNKGQLVPSKSTVTVLKSVSDFDEINHEISYAFLCKKAEKLATALYLITGFLSDNEPLKWNIREGGLAVLSDVTSFGNTVVSETSQRVKKIMSDIEKVISLLEISATAGFISEMNLTVLKEEYLSLVQALASRKKGVVEESFVFGREFFSTRGALKKEEFYKGQIKDTSSPDGVSNSVRNVSSATGSSNISSHLPTQGSASIGSGKVISDTLGIKNETQKNTEKSSRTETILRFIKEKGTGGELSIKDITTQFTDCGEKTIQRELASLVAINVLKKTGDRRWSKYSLA